MNIEVRLNTRFPCACQAPPLRRWGQVKCSSWVLETSCVCAVAWSCASTSCSSFTWAMMVEQESIWTFLQYVCPLFSFDRSVSTVNCTDTSPDALWRDFKVIVDVTAKEKRLAQTWSLCVKITVYSKYIRTKNLMAPTVSSFIFRWD